MDGIVVLSLDEYSRMRDSASRSAEAEIKSRMFVNLIHELAQVGRGMKLDCYTEGEILDCVRSTKFQTVKAIRTKYGYGLKEAKVVVDVMQVVGMVNW